jgi:hypothetical protein
MSTLAAMPVPPTGSCSPRALGRLLGLVASGCVAMDHLARKLKAEPVDLRARLELATWLGFLDGPISASTAPRLSRRGLEYVYGARRRPQVYAEALWDHPVVGPLMAHQPGQPWRSADLCDFLTSRWSGLEAQRLDQLVGSLVAVMQPALGQRPRRRERRPGTQLRLAFARPRAPVTGYRFRAAPAAPEQPHRVDPAVYRSLLQALLDEGELPMLRLGSLLAALGLRGAPAGPYAEMAVRRGDAQRRVQAGVDQLVVTPAAIARRDLSDTVASVALSDPDYRDYLQVLQATGQGDLGAAARYGKLRSRFRCWDERIFGADTTPRAMAHAAHGLLQGRTMAAIPAATPEPELGWLPRPAPFLDLIADTNLLVALPPSIDLLVGGLPAINRALEAAARDPGGPHPAFAPRQLVHGGLVHPGEPVPDRIPDGVSLRLHVIERVPHLALMVALLLQQRLSRGRVSLRLRGDRLRVYHRRRDLGAFLQRADELMRDRGWLVSRRARGGLPEASLKDAAESLGIAVQAGRAFVLQEAFFRRLLQQPEDRYLHDRLVPLGVWTEHRLGEWSVGVEPEPPTSPSAPAP